MFLVLIQLANLLINSYLSKMRTEIGETIFMFGILSIFSICFKCFTDYITTDYSNTIISDFESKQLKKYASMDRTSKEKSTFSCFEEKVRRAKNGMATKYTWGLSCVSDLLAGIIGFCYIVIVYQQYIILMTFFAIHGLWFYFLTKNMMIETDKKRQQSRKKRNELEETIELYGTRLHNDECSVEELLEKKKELMQIDSELSKHWSFVITMQKLPNYLIVIMIAFVSDKSLYVILYLISTSLTNSMDGALYFANQYKTIESDIQDLEDFWENKSFKSDYKQFKIPEILNVSGCINNWLNIIPFIITKGNKYIINGVSGAGKTTCIKGLIGDIDGIKYISDVNEIYHGLNFRKTDIVYMSQSEKESTPTEFTTLRKLFFDENNDTLIKDALELVELTDWFQNNMNNNFDTQIHNEISGGEKTRLSLSIAIYKLLKHNKTCLILDEPDAGLDRELSLTVLNNIITKFTNVTIFIVVHMCECKLKHLNIDAVISVENKQVCLQSNKT